MRFLDRWRSTITISVNTSRTRCLKGHLTRACLADVHTLFESAGLSSGEIYLTGNGHLDFSNDVPRHLHQNIRNIVLGQHNPG